eukprot:TRINITY_DN1888_c0_g1_i1.p1 TRINITY_DN1888_c0_g1~~TRINITY_DN1888_c0_g1_i1.p1  ORF type:complete len:446 (-),score=58.22 TRINITY_DN1888_c0_g1_i1:17-1354(-)
MGCCTTLLKCLFSPFILLYLSVRTYFLPCFGTYISRFVRCFCCFVCLRCCGCKYTDKSFPPNDVSLGDYSDGGPREEVEWRRAADLAADASGHDGRMKLFCGKIEPSDIKQGSVGNCWLMSAFACLAEFPGTIQRCFVTPEWSARGKYTVRIFDEPHNKWVKITVDDYVPCSRRTGQPLFAKPNNDELWVVIYEKAFAKYCGSYGGLVGGNSIWALEAMTGDKVFVMKRASPGPNGTWKRYDLLHHPQTNDKRSIGLKPTEEVYNLERLFDILAEYDKSEALIGASSEAGADTAEDAKNGIVQGHAYSVLEVKRVGKFKLLRLRNPWGKFEWSGDWGDQSPLWKQHPEVARELKYEAKDDGTFWMPLESFAQHFASIDICDRSTGVNDLVIDLHENMGTCGPCVGCSGGCCRFWCMCQGMRRLLCPHRSTGKTREGRHGCCGCCC